MGTLRLSLKTAANPDPTAIRNVNAILDRGSNNFDLIRLLAASGVIFGHSFYLFPTGGFREPVTIFVRNNFSGTLAVGAFFFISGLLITRSFDISRRPLRFASMRIARIFPGAIACLFIVTYVIGPMVTTLPVSSYILSSEARCYFWRNASLFLYGHGCTSLPGVFIGNRIGATPNGSLWTLAPELACYAYVLLLGWMGLTKSSLSIIVTVLSILLLHHLSPSLVPYFSDNHYTDVLKVGMFFIAGVITYALRYVIVIRTGIFVALIVAAAALQKTPVEEYALYAALFYGVLVAAASSRLNRLALPGDYSYGVYLYGYPIQQTVQHFWPAITSYESNLICLPVALVAGYLSWTLIERPVLDGARTLSSGKEGSISSLFRRRPFVRFPHSRLP